MPIYYPTQQTHILRIVVKILVKVWTFLPKWNHQTPQNTVVAMQHSHVMNKLPWWQCCYATIPCEITSCHGDCGWYATLPHKLPQWLLLCSFKQVFCTCAVIGIIKWRLTRTGTWARAGCCMRAWWWRAAVGAANSGYAARGCGAHVSVAPGKKAALSSSERQREIIHTCAWKQSIVFFYGCY